MSTTPVTTPTSTAPTTPTTTPTSMIQNSDFKSSKNSMTSLQYIIGGSVCVVLLLIFTIYKNKKTCRVQNSKRRPLPEIPDPKSTYSQDGNNLYEEVDEIYEEPVNLFRKENEYLDPTILVGGVVLENSFYEA
tara:strand:- start:71 stop:469 length:399 start_codon:yes stop_codon:yes gene_type:complete